MIYTSKKGIPNPKNSINVAKLWQNPSYRAHMQKVHQGQSSFWKGKKRRPLSEAQRIELSTIAKARGFGKWMFGRTPWNKGKVGLLQYKKGVHNSPSTEFKFGHAPYPRTSSKPTRPEIYLDRFLQQNFPKEWKYVGDGKVWIENRNPDFINCNGKKLIIEYDEKYWHVDLQDGAKRTRTRDGVYAKYGYKVLSIDAEVLKSSALLLEKLTDFQKGESHGAK